MVDRPRLVIAVDGPSGSGKSSVCRAVATRLGLPYLDTGAMYRAVCLACLDGNVDLSDTQAVAAVAAGLDLVVGMDPERPYVRVGGEDVSGRIRESRVSLAVSTVAANPGVRSEMVRRQRGLIDLEPDGCVVEGRDITTVVAPDAPVRILLTARADARVARRSLQLHGSDSEGLLTATAAEVTGRDAKDSAVTAFLDPAPGVVVIDTSDLSFEDAVAAVLDLSRVQQPAGRPA